MSFTASLSEIIAANENGLLGQHPTWSRVRLSDIADILNGWAFESSRFTMHKGTPLLRIRDILKTETDAYYDGEFDQTYLVKPGELVIGMDGDFNCALWAGPRALLNQRVCKVTADARFYDHRLLAHVLPGYLSAINSSTSSITVKHLSSYTVADILLPLPPLPEQRRIVAEIETQFARLEAGVAALKRVQANLKRYRTAVLRAACEGRLVPTEAELARAEGRDCEAIGGPVTSSLLEPLGQDVQAEIGTVGSSCRSETNVGMCDERTPASEPSFPLLPSGWVRRTVGQIALVKGGKRLPHGHEYSEEPTEFPYIRVTDFVGGTVRRTGLRYLRPDTQRQIQNYTISSNDVYISIAGTIGITGIVPAVLDGANLTENAAKITNLSSRA